VRGQVYVVLVAGDDEAESMKAGRARAPLLPALAQSVSSTACSRAPAAERCARYIMPPHIYQAHRHAPDSTRQVAGRFL